MLAGRDVTQDAFRQDAFDLEGKLREIVVVFGQGLIRGVAPWAKRILGDIGAIGREVDVMVARELDKSLGIPISKLTPSTQAQVEEWLRANVLLIKSIPEQQADRVIELLREGRSVEETAQRLREIADITDRRARLIARDQIEKLEGQINRFKQTQVGIEKYEWRSRRDNRVRPQHRHQDGKVYRWDTPPPGGHPGEPVACRCYGRAVLE